MSYAKKSSTGHCGPGRTQTPVRGPDHTLVQSQGHTPVRGHAQDPVQGHEHQATVGRVGGVAETATRDGTHPNLRTRAGVASSVSQSTRRFAARLHPRVD